MSRSHVSVAALAAAVVVASLVAAPASADRPSGPRPKTTPVITAPSAGTVFADQADVSATSTAASVKFTLTDAQFESVSVTVPVSGGVASAQIPTSGFIGTVTIAARDCDATCSPPAPGPAGLSVSNTPLTVNEPAAEVHVGPDDSGQVPIDIDSPGGYLKVSAFSRTLESAAPLSGVLDMSGVSDGAYTPSVVRCSILDHSICEKFHKLPDIVIVRFVEVRVLGKSAPPLSPNGDGINDTLTRNVTFLDWAAPYVDDVDVTWSLQGHGSTLLDVPVTTVPGDTAASFTIDPADAGVTLPDGRYRLEADVSATFHGETVTGAAALRVAVVVDTTADPPTDTTVSDATFYPLTRGPFPQEEEGTATVERDAKAHVQVVDAHGDVVQSGDASTKKTTATYTWDGTDTRGRVAPEGRYRMEWSQTDAAGNTSEAAAGPWFHLSYERLYVKHWNKTLSAKSTMARDFSERCSSVVSPGAHGWKGSLGYFSNSKCDGGTTRASIAAALHVVQLPRAYEYQAIDLHYYSGAARKGSRDRAILEFYLADHSLDPKLRRMGDKIGLHRTGLVRPKDVIDSNGEVAWAVVTGGGARYDVRSFTIHLTYLVFGRK